MVMPDLARVWTRQEVLALPDDGNRYELVDGELLVSPSPRPVHQRAVGAFYRRLHGYVRANRLGEALFSPADLDLGSGQLLQPDVFVIGPAAPGPREWSDVGIPRLVVEVLSPTTARYDRIIKRRRFQRSGVPVYWIVDVDARLVEVWIPTETSPRVVDERLEWRPDPETVPLTIDLPEVFREILDE
ncbi:MAG: Uma2 family endonuclease [Gemmatimonadales bacterium]|nr:Uma2 family endonuclease [Gemmatimonadales bacterium]